MGLTDKSIQIHAERAATLFENSASNSNSNTSSTSPSTSTSTSNSNTNSKSNSTPTSYDPKSKNTEIKIPEFLMPYSTFCLSWDFFIFNVIFYNAIVTPLRISIMTEEVEILTAFDYIFDFIFCFDTILRFYMPYIDPDTQTAVKDIAMIKNNYAKSWSFYINVFASLPVLNIVFGIESSLVNVSGASSKQNQKKCIPPTN